MLSDTEVIWRIRQGDKKQFELLFRSSYVSLVRYAKSLIKDHDDAEEIVQDLFYRFWKDRDKIKIESSLNGYLFRSVYNRCLHYIDHNKVIGQYAKEAQYLNPDSPPDPSDIVHYNELQEKIVSIMEKLPERCSKIFSMSRFEGLKYSEIAEKLSISIKTVESNMGKALKEFRKELEEK
jgi:RNA polymerase sigma-70 factor, ECF subfamily